MNMIYQNRLIYGYNKGAYYIVTTGVCQMVLQNLITSETHYLLDCRSTQTSIDL